jgi:hypothetical protein
MPWLIAATIMQLSYVVTAPGIDPEVSEDVSVPAAVMFQGSPSARQPLKAMILPIW